VTALADATDDLGLIASASTSFYEPYVLATKLATIDALSDATVTAESSSWWPFGDVDGDGETTIGDATLAQQYVTGNGMPDSFNSDAADVNDDGTVNTADVIEILEAITSLDDDSEE
jgi:hypothetical protein